jgi:type IX secretion system PorP/SprF family membrane protein
MKLLINTKITLLIIISFFIKKDICAQDIHFSQFYAMPLYLNPANAGLDYDINAGIIYRQQWKAVATPFNTYGVSISGRNNKKKKKGVLGAGFDCYYDKSGDAVFTTLTTGISIAYHAKLNSKSKLSSGVKVNFNQKNIKNPNFQWGEQYDGQDYNANYLTGESLQNIQSTSFFDLAGGLNYKFQSGEKYMTANNRKIIDIGIAGFHLNRANTALYNNYTDKTNSRFIAYFNCFFGVANSNLSILPKGYFQMQGGHKEFLAGILFNIKTKDESKITGFVTASSFNLGILYRGKDAFIGVFQYEIKNYIIGISYDINASKLTNASNGRGAYELSLRFINPSPFLRKGAHKDYGGSMF